MRIRKTSSSTLPLFAEEQPSSAFIETNKERIKRWASRGVLFGTSSWKYPGWKGQVYNRPYPSKKAFNQECLTEYSRLFPTVCADFALYDFPKTETLHVLHEQTEDEFRISLKVTDRITVRRYPSIPRYGDLAGKENPDFLNPDLFQEAFLGPVEQLRKKRGVIIFEFSAFKENSGVTCESFIEQMDNFLGALPKGYEYAVEIRNRSFLKEEYLAMLARHGAGHVLNNWTRMPSILEQIQIGGILSAPFSVARALLKPGRYYEDAVRLFEPYDRIKEEVPDLRLGLVDAVQRCAAEGRTLYAYVNNRAEGNAPKTIEGILDMLDRYPAKKL